MELLLQQLNEYKNNIYSLANHYHLHIGYHSNLPLLVLNYHVVASPKDHPVVNICRGLVLEYKKIDETDLQFISIVAKGFNRFFYYSEHTQIINSTVETIQAYDKVDGTYMLLFYFNGQWIMCTRHNFSEDYVVPNEVTYEQLFVKTSGFSNMDDFQKFCNAYCDIHTTYLFELCSMLNRIITPYETPKLYLLGFIKYENNEWKENYKNVDEVMSMVNKLQCNGLKISSVPHRLFDNWKSLNIEMNHLTINDPLFEGFVCYTNNIERFKFKNPIYQLFHRLKYRGWHTANAAILLPWLTHLDTFLPLIPVPQYELEYISQIIQDLKSNLEIGYNSLANTWSKYEESNDSHSLFHDHPLKALLYTKLKFPELELKDIWNNPKFDKLKLNYITGLQSSSKDYCKLNLLDFKQPHNNDTNGLAEIHPIIDEKSNKFIVHCYCSHKMNYIRLKRNRTIPKACFCGHLTGLTKTYFIGTKLWVCENEKYCPGTMESRPDGSPLGIPASPFCKQLRLMSHELINRLINQNLWSYNKINLELGSLLKLSPQNMHMAQLGISECLRCIQHLQSLTEGVTV
ncbi:unnamed protein product [Didymodactylos carnosus]|uniref:T4 RNA ligase 1-like N-terminal domain-containing protein n=1 Tax=Didymodactylos carnosus TaxID=1234261 RepID=A0A8S2DE16_9BILA|nr:unnamed protein product [Didymodactylos carnosus]CAF3712967.1 unnamed protein product [Didymodactylos carnosus]